MPAAVRRDHRLKRFVVESLREEDWMPPRNTIRQEMKLLGLKGNASDDVKWLRAGEAVTRDMAAYFANWVQENPYAAPEAISGPTRDRTEEEAIDALFEVVEPIAYHSIDEQSDPAAAGVVRFGAWAVDLFSGFLEPSNQADSPLAYFDPSTAPEEYVRHMYTEAGFAQSGGQRVRAPLSVAQARERGERFFGDDPAFHKRYAKASMELNPDCLRYAVNARGQRVGMSLVQPITEAAWEATLRAERGFYDEPREGDLCERSNIVRIVSLAEVYDEPIAPTLANIAKKRHTMLTSLLLQIARLLNPARIEPIRAVSYEMIDSNKSRLAGSGFERVGRDKSEVGPPTNIVVFDGREPHQTIKQKGRGIVSHAIWRMRAKLDGVDPETWGL